MPSVKPPDGPHGSLPTGYSHRKTPKKPSIGPHDTLPLHVPDKQDANLALEDLQQEKEFAKQLDELGNKLEAKGFDVKKPPMNRAKKERLAWTIASAVLGGTKGAIDGIGSILALPVVKFSGFFVTATLGLAVRVIEVYRTAKDAHTYKKHTKKLYPKPIKRHDLDVNTAKKSLEDISEMTTKLIERRQAAHAAHETKNRKGFEQWLAAMTNLKADQSHNFKQYLQAKGIEYDGDYAKFVKDASTAEGRQALFDQYAFKAKNTLFRNAMKNIIKERNKATHDILKLKRNQSIVMLVSTAVAAAIQATLQIAVFTALISIPTSAIGGIGAGLFAVSLLMIGVGLIYMRVKRPHRFHEYVRFVDFRIRLYKAIRGTEKVLFSVPQAINKSNMIKRFKEAQLLSAQYTELQGLLQQGETIDKKDPRFKELLQGVKSDITLESLDTKHKERLEKKLQDAEQALQKYEHLEGIVTYWTKRLEPLETRIRIANQKDAEKAAGVTPILSEMPQTDFLDNMIDDLFNGDIRNMDAESQKMMKEFLSINVEKIIEDNPEDTRKAFKEAFLKSFGSTAKKQVKIIQEESNIPKEQIAQPA